MKILMINDYNSALGGVETYLTELCAELNKEHTVKVLSSDLYIKKGGEANFTYSSLKKLPKATYFPLRLWNPFSYFKLKSILKAYAPDIVHMHYIYDYTSPSILSLLKNYPTIMTLHTQTILCPLNKYDYKTGILKYNRFDRSAFKLLGPIKYLTNTVKYFFYRKYINNIDLFLAVSGFIQKSARAGGLNPVQKLYLGINLPSHVELPNNQTILFIGRLSRHKGVDIAIKAFRIVQAKFPDATFIIAGDGEEMENLKSLANELKIDKHIQFIGWQSQKNINKLLSQCQISVFPSTWEEPFGLVGIEAMSIGRPVVGSNIGGIPEWLLNGKTGYLFEPTNDKKLAEKICLLLDNHLLAERMSQRAVIKAKDFNMPEHVKKLLHIYRHLISKNT